MPSNLAYSLIGILQKIVEVVFYDTWSFALKPKALCFVDNRMHRELLSLVSTIDLTRWNLHSSEENPFDFNARCYRLLLYTMARLLFAQGYHSSIVDHLAISDNNLVSIFCSDDVLLFRMLLTLLLMENTAIKDGFLEVIGFDHYCLIDWLVSPETDCLAYLLAYTKRLAAASTDDAEEKRRWYPPACWLELHREGVREVMECLAKSLQTLHIDGSLPFAPDLLITHIHMAVKVLSSMTQEQQNIEVDASRLGERWCTLGKSGGTHHSYTTKLQYTLQETW
ncbi:unnamed protein product [Hydatigera taeniaeformis]|uniref:Uncharacterized protein n=1 Tax=Hydatigena taeniaeformis TaxID=6205 RepID=A0A3P7GGY6_HYDTA|nr:unnamed protein product [Hydatigera taeniaeformis]